MPGVTDGQLRSLRTAARAVLQSEYGLENARLTLLRNGRNIVYRVDAAGGERFVLRVHNHDRLSDEAVRVQMRWLQSIQRDTDLSVPTPVGVSKIRMDGSTYRSVLLRWVPGRRVRTGAAFVRPTTLRTVGRATAKLHLHAAKGALSARKGCPQLDEDSFFGRATCAGPRGREILKSNEYDVVRRAAQKIRRVMRSLRDRPEQVGLIHADLEPANWVFHRGDARPIDFDEFGVGHFLFDLMQVIWTHGMWPDYPNFRKSLLDGYESLRPIPRDLRPHLDLFQAICFVQWLNKGLSIDQDEQADFQRWRGPTVQRIATLCDV
jgi:Ser/Thr protein kinase RdoA (MazF antagonist)